MDRVRFGRALGVGAREAAKALVKAADAASAPNPRAHTPRDHNGAARPTAAAAQTPSAPRTPTPTHPTVAVAGQVEKLRVTSAGVKRGGRKFGEAMWAPLSRAGGVLWFEVTGVLFAMVALAFAIFVWEKRGDLAGTGNDMHRAWLGVAMLLMFGYFTVSSYVRAARRGRR